MWERELDLCAIKSVVSLDVLRSKTSDMVRTELWVGLLAYNLVRQSLLQAASHSDQSLPPRQLSFCVTLPSWRRPG